jgi:hypothetical protein
VRTISLKLPQTLLAELDAEARRRQISKSRVVRDALTRQFNSNRKRKARTCAELAADLIGSQPGPLDASTNKSYLHRAILKKSGGNSHSS